VRSADPTLLGALNGSYQMSVYADAWYGGEVVVEGLWVVDGTLEFESSGSTQGVLRIKVADPTGDLVALKYSDPLAAYGSEIHLRWSVQVPGGEEIDPISLGWYRIQINETDEFWVQQPNGQLRSGGAIVSLECLDRMSVLVDARQILLTQPAAGATCLGEIKRLLGTLAPLGAVDSTIIDATVPASIVYTEDRMSALNDLADALGAVLRVNGDGAIDVRKPTVPADTPVWTIRGGPGGTLSSYRSTMSRDSVVNAVVATGETATDHAPIQAVAYDLDLTSPTVWDGPYGEVPAFFYSPLLTTPAMVQAAAKTRLDSYRRGRDRTYTLQTVPNPLLELDDPIQVILPDRQFVGRLTKLSLPLSPGKAQVEVRVLESAVTTVVT
jgi:hypothetical protein